MNNNTNNDFKLLSNSEKTINYINNLLPNYPKKEIILKQNIEKTQYELIENIFSFNINKDSVRIRNKHLKEILLKLSMIDYYIRISYHKKYISTHQMDCITKRLIEIRKITYGLIKKENETL